MSPVKRTLQALWALGVLGAVYLALTHSDQPLPLLVAQQPWATWFVGPVAAAATGRLCSALGFRVLIVSAAYLGSLRPSCAIFVLYGMTGIQLTSGGLGMCMQGQQSQEGQRVLRCWLWLSHQDSLLHGLGHIKVSEPFWLLSILCSTGWDKVSVYSLLLPCSQSVMKFLLLLSVWVLARWCAVLRCTLYSAKLAHGTPLAGWAIMQSQQILQICLADYPLPLLLLLLQVLPSKKAFATAN